MPVNSNLNELAGNNHQPSESHQNPDNRQQLFWIHIRTCLNLMLFLISLWYFFTYGANDVAIPKSIESLYGLLIFVPILILPILMFGFKKLDVSHRKILEILLSVIAFCCLAFLNLIILEDPIFSSRWTWAFNDLRELNYLQPSIKVITSTIFLLLFLIDSEEQNQILYTMFSENSEEYLLQKFNRISYLIVGFLGWGIAIEVMTTQPIWVSLMILLNLSFIVLIFEFIRRFIDFKHGSSENKVIIPQFEKKKLTPKDLLTRVSILLVITIFSLVIWLYPAQLIYQEGPTNPWGNELICSVVLVLFLVMAWYRFKIPSKLAFMSVVLSNILFASIIALGWQDIPGTVDIGRYFIAIGIVSYFCWILLYGYSWDLSKGWKISQWFIWLWALSGFILLENPIFEIWEMEEGLRKIIAPDAYGTGVGYYYGMIALVWLAILAISILVIIAIRILEKKRKNERVSVQFHEERVDLSNIARKIAASILIIGILIGGMINVFASIKIRQECPTIVSRIGDHGVLWKANIYDRVLPYYRPDFSQSPVNSTIEIYAMKGETETIQFVYTSLASKMVSFNFYSWKHDKDLSSADNLWKAPNGTATEIPISMGQIAYISAYDSNIADVLLPWTAFITGERRNYPFWLEISVPANTTEGVYTTQFTINTNSYLQRNIRMASLSFELKLTVWNITKPTNQSLTTCINYFPENPEYARELVDLGLRYGISPYGGVLSYIWGDTSSMVEYDPGNLSKGITINWTRFDTEIALLFNKGLSQITLNFYPGIDCRNQGDAVLNGSKDNYLTLIKWFYGNASQHLKTKYTPWGTTWESHVITQHSDEPDPRISPYAIDAFVKLYSMLNNVTDIKMFQTLAYEPAFDPWLDYLDIWVLTPDSFSIEVAQKIREKGGEVWTYSNGDNFPGQDSDLRTPLIMSRLRGWVDFKYNITGFLDWVFYWNYNDAGRSGSGYDGRGDGTEIVPIAGGYAPTLRLVAFRDGVEDYDLLRQLDLSIKRAKDLGLQSSEAYTRAVEVLNSINSALGPQPADQKWNIETITRKFNHTPSLYLDLRIQAADALEQLKFVM